MNTLIGMGSGKPGTRPRRALPHCGGRTDPGRKAPAGSCLQAARKTGRPRIAPRRSLLHWRRPREGRAGVQRRHRVLLRRGCHDGKAVGLVSAPGCCRGLSRSSLAAAVGRPWQGWKLVSAHGCTCDPVAECMQGETHLFPHRWGRNACHPRAEWRQRASGTPRRLWAKSWAGRREDPVRARRRNWPQAVCNSLSVLLVERRQPPRRAPGLPDEAFDGERFP